MLEDRIKDLELDIKENEELVKTLSDKIIKNKRELQALNQINCVHIFQKTGYCELVDGEMFERAVCPKCGLEAKLRF